MFTPLYFIFYILNVLFINWPISLLRFKINKYWKFNFLPNCNGPVLLTTQNSTSDSWKIVSGQWLTSGILIQYTGK